MKISILVLFAFVGISAHADEVVRVNTNPAKPEGLCFAQMDAQKSYSLCEFTDYDVRTTKPITAEEHKSFLADLEHLLPKPAPDTRRPTCKMPVEVSRLKDSKLYCFEDLTSKQRLAFRTWFKKTRQRLAKK